VIGGTLTLKSEFSFEVGLVDIEVRLRKFNENVRKEIAEAQASIQKSVTIATPRTPRQENIARLYDMTATLDEKLGQVQTLKQNIG
jgi:hypothetical protein